MSGLFSFSSWTTVNGECWSLSLDVRFLILTFQDHQLHPGLPFLLLKTHLLALNFFRMIYLMRQEISWSLGLNTDSLKLMVIT